MHSKHVDQKFQMEGYQKHVYILRFQNGLEFILIYIYIYIYIYILYLQITNILVNHAYLFFVKVVVILSHYMTTLHT